VGGLAEHEHNKHQSGSGMGSGTGSQYGAQGTDSFNNPQAPVSQSGAAVYNADGQAVGTGSTSLTPGQTVSTTSGRPSAYDSAANPGSRAETGRSGGGVSSHVPGTQSFRDTHGSGNTGSGTGTGSDYNSGRGTASGTGLDYNSGPGSATSGGSSRGGGGGGLASVIPGTQAYRDKHVRQGDDFEGGGIGQGGGSNTGSGGGSGTHDNTYYEGRNSGSGVGSGVGSGSGHHGHHHGHHGHEHAGAGAAAGQWTFFILCFVFVLAVYADTRSCECPVSASTSS